jgi:hypothetical protein
MLKGVFKNCADSVLLTFKSRAFFKQVELEEFELVEKRTFYTTSITSLLTVFNQLKNLLLRRKRLVFSHNPHNQ